MRFLVNLHVTLPNLEPLLRKFKYFITALIDAEQLLLWITSRNLFVFLKSGENVNLEELINAMLVGYNFTENFTVDVAM